MPQYGTSLACPESEAKHLWLNGTTTRHVPVDHEGKHSFDIRGLAEGTILIASTNATATELQYDVTIRTNNADSLRDIMDKFPTAKDNERNADSRAIVSTPGLLGGGACMRYDIVIRVPVTVKKLHIQAHTKAHIKFAEGAHAVRTLEDLYVTSYAMAKGNLIVAHEDLRASRIKIVSREGYIVGGLSVNEVGDPFIIELIDMC
jgi:hypothetical protein